MTSPLTTRPTEAFRLGEHVVEPATNRVLGSRGESVRLEPRVMDVLVRLAQEPGQVVSRDQLLDSVWPGTYVTEHSLSRCISDLRQRLGDDPASPRYIETIRKRGYRLIAPLAPYEAEPPPTSVGSGSPLEASRRRRAAWVVAATFGALAILYSLRGEVTGHAPTPPLTPLTSFRGSELDPALSSDGQAVAFAWNGANGGNYDIYVQPIGAATPRRLTSDPGEDKNPAWSPDGRSLAFVRSTPHGSGIHRVRVDGGGERRLVATSSGDIPDLAWSAEGRFLYFADRGRSRGATRIERLELHTGERTVVTRPEATVSGDRDLALSPDGRRLAFARAVVPGVEDLWVVAATGGHAQRLTDDATSINGLAWTPDGESILFSSMRGGSSQLWRIEAGGGRPDSLLELGEGASDPALVGGRLVFERRAYDANVWESRSDERDSPRLLPALASTRWDSAPVFSPDGSQIAFTSDRAGSAELWISARGGEGPPRRLATRHPVLSPAAWSPGGDGLVFSLQDGPHTHLYRAASEGGEPSRLTGAAANDVAPSYSRDGRWIYFGSDRSGTWQIWKISADGGRATRVTRHGGLRALEAADGETLFVSRPDGGGLWSLPVSGGARRQVLAENLVAPQGSWTVGVGSLYYLAAAGDPAAAMTIIHRLDLGSGSVTAVSPPLRGLQVAGLGLTEAFDGSRLLFGRVDGGDGDLVLVDGFDGHGRGRGGAAARLAPARGWPSRRPPRPAP